jgi:hypothetical protein
VSRPPRAGSRSMSTVVSGRVRIYLRRLLLEQIAAGWAEWLFGVWRYVFWRLAAPFQRIQTDYRLIV